MKQLRDAKGRFLSKNHPQQLSVLLEQTTGIIGLKGFTMDFKCLDKQYKEGRHYHVDGQIRICANGLHLCTDPLDAFTYYPPYNSRYAIVVGSGNIDNIKHGKSIEELASDTKHAASDLYVVKELELDKLVNTLVYSASKSTVLDRVGDAEKTEYPLDIKYRVVSASKSEAILTTDTQDILCIGKVMVNDNRRGYAGPLYDLHLQTLLSVVTCQHSISYNQFAVSLSAYSIARGKSMSMTLGCSSIAYADYIAVATSSGSVAITQCNRSCCICQSSGKVIMYGDFSIGILGEASSAEVYGCECTLMLRYLPALDTRAIFLLKDGTNLLWQAKNKPLLVIVAGVDIKSSNTRKGVHEYTGKQIRNAFLRKANKISKTNNKEN